MLGGSQPDYVSGDRADHNLRCAEHQRKRRWSSDWQTHYQSQIDGDEYIRKTQRQIVC
jgi:hypothetical protein